MARFEPVLPAVITKCTRVVRSLSEWCPSCLGAKCSLLSEPYAHLCQSYMLIIFSELYALISFELYALLYKNCFFVKNILKVDPNSVDCLQKMLKTVMGNDRTLSERLPKFEKPMFCIDKLVFS